MRNKTYHEPVMVQEVVKYLGLEAPLKTQAQKKIIDATLGTGGYTLNFVKKGASVLAIDMDKKMLEVASERLNEACPTPEDCFGGSFNLVHGNFKDIQKIAISEDFRKVDAIVFDLGVSSPQITSEKMGISFQEPEAPLDMRLNPDTQKVMAKDILNAVGQGELARLFDRTMPKNKARKLAKKIVEAREEKKFETVGDFLEVIKKVVEKRGKIHPATTPFLALRMAVNSELENLEEALPGAFNLLKKGGLLIIVSFHSGEDAIVKEYFNNLEEKGEAKVVTQKPETPSDEESEKNPRSRSAKLRVLKKK